MRFEASSGVSAVRPIAVTGRLNDGGSGWPSSFVSSGLGSNRSMWLGPPSRKHQMTLLAVALKCGGLAASGPAGSSARPSLFQQGHEGQQAHAAAGAGQEIAAGVGAFVVRRFIGWSLSL